MFKPFKRGIYKVLMQKRSFLSEAYRCEKAWKARLETSLLKEIQPQNLFITLEHKQMINEKISAVDIDIFANTIVMKSQTEELLDLIHNLRLSTETTNTLESTHHAVIRYLLDNDCTEDLINVLHDRLHYGIFPDDLCYNLLMDTYIKRKDYANAAKIAVLPMLQEYSENGIINTLCVYSCHKYLENPNDWLKPQIVVDDTKEEIKVRVAYLKNFYFDDHFDLQDPRDLVGKTLAFYGKIMNNTLGRTCQLRGLILYKKYQDISELIEQWLKENKYNVVYEEIFDLIKKDNENKPNEEITVEFQNLMSQVDKLKALSLCKDSLTEILTNEVESAIAKQSEIDISEQLKKYIEWEKEREIALDKQLKEIDRQKRIQNIKNMKEDLEKQELLLTFFDNEETIELQIEDIEEKEALEMKRLHAIHHSARKLKKLEEEEVYIPPTITK
ncbi:uncharacterized protein LOC143149538 [Ptiloglossa arizonensis]|uniref:uncharacterized protein LOC143149538 n=1 Tax=Ptiloglossa arizonensis TaxID=3350558 RepID=UPI003F9F5C44